MFGNKMNQQDKLKEAERNGFYKGFKIGGIVIMILAYIVTSVSAATTIPRIEPYVNDFAGLLSPQEESQLNQIIDRIENRTTFEIAIVTVAGTDGQDRLEFAGKIGDQNGVGKKNADNGIVVLWSTADDQGGAIATGRGSESFITDATTGTIGRAARTFFDKGEYYKGMNYIVVELDKAIIAHQTGNETISGSGEDNSSWEIWIVVIIIVVFFVFKFGIIPSGGGKGSDSGGFGGGGFGGGGSKW